MPLTRGSASAASVPNISAMVPPSPQKLKSKLTLQLSSLGSRVRSKTQLIVEDGRRALKVAIRHHRAEYIVHERLLLIFLSRKTKKMPKLMDPLARWRTAWRWLGVLLLLLNCTAQCADSWARYRCDEAGPLLHVESCSDYGRHRAHIASGLGTAVQVFSLGELMLGLGTAHALPSASPSLLRYGTSVGPTSVVLFGIDGLLLLSARPLSSDAFEGWWTPPAEDTPPPLEPPRRAGDSLERQPWWARGWLGDLTRPLISSRPVKSIVGYQRLKALKPMPWPIQTVIDRAVIAWLGTGDEGFRNLIKNLPFIGDALLEGDLLQAAVTNALSSVKLLVLIASAIKAARMRMRLRAVKRTAAALCILSCVRRWLAHGRVARLREKHERAALAVEALSAMRVTQSQSSHGCGAAKMAAASGGGWGYGWSGASLPADMDQIGAMRARSPQGARAAREALRAMGQETEAILLASL